MYNREKFYLNIVFRKKFQNDKKWNLQLTTQKCLKEKEKKVISSPSYKHS